MTGAEGTELPVRPPFPVDVPKMVLNGAWTYAQPVPEGFPARALEAGACLVVPGEVVMQGLPLDAASEFALERAVHVPDDWAGKVIRLRFEAVYSVCTVFVDGVEVARHLGGFTPFDVDLTRHVQAGRDVRITLRLCNASLADDLSFGSRYAGHALAGIPRDVVLYALPPAHMTALTVATLFPDGYDRALLRLTLAVSAPVRVEMALEGPDGDMTDLGIEDLTGPRVIDRTVDRPHLWDTDRPQLYHLRLRIGAADYAIPVGFREIAVRDRQLHLNGRRIFLRGVNHHETHPLTGRADTARWAETDVALFKAAHVNYIRTSHYPPVPELLDACDRAGILVEVEAPICFAFGSFGHTPKWEDYDAETQQAASDHILAVSLEMVVAHGLHPSVALWSVANESQWCPPFARSSAAIRAADPTRPLTFNWAKYDDACRDHVEIANEHYPDAGSLGKYDNESRPLLLGEFAHLYCYNDRELMTDPGLRGLWGGYLGRQWAEVLEQPNTAGGAIWAAVDDWFLVPQAGGGRRGRGYGAWGPVDGWRRIKPEYDGMRQVFDPVQLPLRAVAGDGPISLPVVNRWDATDMAEMRIDWDMGGSSGTTALTLAPGAEGVIELPAPPQGANALNLRFRHDALGYDRCFAVALGEAPTLPVPAAAAIMVQADGWQLGDFAVDGLGNLSLARSGEAALFIGGPDLALVPRYQTRQGGVWTDLTVEPLRNAATGWTLSGIAASDGGLRISGCYDIANGSFLLTAHEDGSLSIGYDFLLCAKFEPWQTGLVFALPRSLDRLVWQRAGFQDPLPHDHIARTTGSARAYRGTDRPVTPDAPPTWPWALDETAEGTNDFRATRHGIARSALIDPLGRGIAVISDGSQHARAGMDGSVTLLHVFDHSGLGSEYFLRSFAQNRTMQPGEALSGIVRIAAAGTKDR